MNNIANKGRVFFALNVFLKILSSIFTTDVQNVKIVLVKLDPNNALIKKMKNQANKNFIMKKLKK